ncbi:rho GTPase-activating protein, partial [Tulasnella sp. 408]
VEAAAEPEGPSSSSTLRNSQIIHCTGFLNRFAKPSKFNGQGLSSDKGWKPYKAQLIGTKLYFYKPPADRTAEIKDLFLTGPTPVEIMTKEPEPVAEVEASPNPRDGRRKRVYWGRARHAELVVSEAGEVLSGSADALIHEIVFATAFKLGDAQADSAEAANEPTDTERVDETRWKEFATAVLLFLPSYTEKPKFEAEVLRDLSSFERGASEEEKASNASRLQWLLAEYLRLHGTAADEHEWRSLMTRPETPEPQEISASESSSSVPTITLSPSPAVPQSPTFANPPSPQQRGGRPPVERSASNDSVARSKLAALLAEEGLSRDTLARLDHRRVADSLALYQRSQVGVEPILASDFLATGDPADVVSAFSGSDDRPHWLTRLVVEMILGQVGKTEMKGEDGVDGNRTSSSTYVRAGAVARWIHVGERCLSNGDECSWKAIVAALCCIAVVRLEKVWKRVDERDLQTMEDWVKGERKLEGEGVSVWFGDLRKAMADAVEGARVRGQPDRFSVAPLLAATKRLRASLRRWEACSAMKKSQRQPTPDTNALVEFWARCRLDPSPRMASINQILPLSFAIESRQRGQYQPYFWKPQPTHSAAQSILPLLFPEPLPTVSLIDRNALIRTKKETLLGPVPGAEVNEAQVQKLTNPNVRSKSRTPSRQRNIAEVDLDETLIPCFGGELVLKLPRDDGKSRPTSFVDSLFPNASPSDGAKAPTRGNSIRLNTGSRLERKGSQMRLSRRSSLPSISQRNSLLIPDAPVVESSIRVTVKSGTIDRLVDVLVSGLDGVGVTHADDNGEMPLRDGKSKSFKVDRAEFARVWWTGFRSFVTPLVLFELLRKRFVGGHATSDPLAAALKRDSSPSGESTESPATTQLRLDVLSTLSYWFTVGGGAQDILDDLELYQSVQAFLNSDLPGTSPDVLSVRKSLLETFVSLTSLPVRDVAPPKEPNGTEPSTHRFGSQPPPLDEVTPDDLVSNLDSIAQTVFRGVTEANMFELADILETQTTDRTGWFSFRDVSSQDDGAVIQDLYIHIQNVEPSPLITSGSQHEHLYRLLSPSLRSVIRAHNSLRDWFIFKLANPAIPYSTRLKRMELIIRAVEVCRNRAQDTDQSSEEFDPDQPLVRSFIEAVLVSAILSPESRAYARAWHDVAGNRNTSVEDLASLVSIPTIPTKKGASLTIDPAWIMERMLEIITLPDVIEREESQSLINLEKRRFLHNLVVNTAGLAPRTNRASEAERQDMERLGAMGREARQGTYDYRSVREAAQREMSHLSFNHGKRL